jgi:outer membrane protein TolC
VGVGAALVVQEDQLALTQGAVALNLIAVYRALGGGWKNGPLSSCRRWP